MANTKVTSAVIADGAITPSKIASGDFYFDTNTLYIDSTNNRIGIGNANPDTKLSVGTFGDTARAAVFNGGSILIDGGAASEIIIGDGNVAYMSIQTTDNATAMNIRNFSGSSDLVTIERASGNVGIGTTSPASPTGFGTGGILHLKGSVGNDCSIVLEGLSGSGGRQEIGASGGALQFYRGAATGSMTESMRIDSSGTVLIGKTTTNSNVEGIILSSNDFIQATRSGGICFSANRRDSTGTIQNFEYNGGTVGTISVSTSSTSYNTTSDYRLKENVDYDFNALERVAQLKPARFNFITDETDTTVDGFLAHEVQDIVPEAITGVKDEMQEEEYEVTPAELDEEGNVVTEAVMGTREVPKYQGIDQSKLVPLLTKAIQEQQTIIDDLKARIETLENA